MDYSQGFIGGVAPGGLRTPTEIRILLCYLLDSIHAPIAQQDLLKAIELHGLANYFEVLDALSVLEKNAHISVDNEGNYTIAESGSEIARSLDTTLPLVVRDTALRAAINLIARAKNERENHVDILQTERGFQVTCHISDGTNDMMTLSVIVPDKMQADMVVDKFYASPEKIYALMLNALTGYTGEGLEKKT